MTQQLFWVQVPPRTELRGAAALLTTAKRQRQQKGLGRVDGGESVAYKCSEIVFSLEKGNYSKCCSVDEP